MTTIFTKSEVKAYHLINGEVGNMDTNPVNYSEYGNKIIALAEQIKAERVVVIINKNL